MARRWTIRLASVGLLAFAAWWWRQRAAAMAVTPTTTPPAPAAPPPPRWLPPVDGDCPAGYPVKVNESSGIIHVPGGRFYARTIPERCYANAEDAEADGYRRAKA